MVKKKEKWGGPFGGGLSFLGWPPKQIRTLEIVFYLI
jgi:hypothetical protein